MKSLVVLLSLFVFTSSLLTAQQAKPAQTQTPQRPPWLNTPQVHSDNSVTFQFLAPNAQEVKLTREGTPEPLPMQKDDKGVWTVNTPPLPPDYYGYSIVVDGIRMIDPYNHPAEDKPALEREHGSCARPAFAAMGTQRRAARRDSSSFLSIQCCRRSARLLRVHAPGLRSSREDNYPVLYLLHGYSDDASGWTAVGRANVILDNLIAQGKTKPMIVVMPLGYGTMEMITLGWGVWGRTDIRDKNFSNFRQALLTEVMPKVESQYRITNDRDSRAIAGLSMGGSESLLTGLNNLDKFAWVGAFSSGGIPDDFEKDFPGLDAKANQQLHLLWIACGTDDRLITVNRNFREWLKTKGVQHTDIETPGMHTWMVWRRNLAEFSELLFR